MNREFDDIIELAREIPLNLPPPSRREEVRTAVLSAAAGSRPPAWRAVPSRRSRDPRLVIAIAAAAAVLVFLLWPRGATSSHVHATVTAGPEARYAMISSAPDEIVRLEAGTLEVSVAPLHGGERFRVIVGDAEVEVRGTAFVVTADGDKLVSVDVYHGRVEVRPHDRAATLLGAGGAWRAEPTRTATSDVSARTSDTKPTSDVSARTSDAKPSSGVSARTSDTKPSSDASARTSDTKPSSDASTRTSDTKPSSDASTRTSDTKLSSDARTSDTKPKSSDATAGTSTASASASVPVPVPEPPARAVEEIAYDEAWSAMRSKDFGRAATAFARVMILAPDGGIAEDAMFWHAVALARGGRRGQATTAFRDFLDAHARSPHAGEANAMLGWILLDAGARGEAVRRFRAAVDDPRKSVRDSARSGLDAAGQ